MEAMSSNGTAKRSWSTNARRSAGDSVSSTTSSARPTESAISASCSGSLPAAGCTLPAVSIDSSRLDLRDRSMSRQTRETTVVSHPPKFSTAPASARFSRSHASRGCGDLHAPGANRAAESDERLFTVAAWRDAPYFTDAERAALALAEAVTRLADRTDAVPDEIWNEAARHYDERALASLILSIALINVWNRLNVATRQVAGEWVKSAHNHADGAEAVSGVAAMAR